jgi:hypothetical protein
MKPRKAANDSRVLTEPLITMEFDEIFEQPFDQIECVGTIGMPGQQYSLECRLHIFWRLLTLVRLFLILVLAH